MKGVISPAIIAVIGAAIGGLFTFITMAKEVEPEYVEILQRELRSLRSEIAQERASNLSLTLQLADLQRDLGDSVDMVESQAVFAFLNRMKRPAWCKRVVSKQGQDRVPTFVMAFLNHAYEVKFQVSAARFTGRTDFDIYPPYLADEYYSNDMRAYVTKDYFEFEERTVAQVEPLGFAKWWVKIPSGTEYICGLEVGN
jgi:hypothetical protein